MVRLVGCTLREDRRIVVALTQIFGIGVLRAKFICDSTNISVDTKVFQLTEVELQKLRDFIATFELEGDLRRRIFLNIKRLKDIKCYRGIRHRMSLPVHGQRTRTNAKTRKKKRKT